MMHKEELSERFLTKTEYVQYGKFFNRNSNQKVFINFHDNGIHVKNIFSYLTN